MLIFSILIPHYGLWLSLWCLRCPMSQYAVTDLLISNEKIRRRSLLKPRLQSTRCSFTGNLQTSNPVLTNLFGCYKNELFRYCSVYNTTKIHCICTCTVPLFVQYIAIMVPQLLSPPLAGYKHMLWGFLLMWPGHNQNPTEKTTLDDYLYGTLKFRATRLLSNLYLVFSLINILHFI